MEGDVVLEGYYSAQHAEMKGSSLYKTPDERIVEVTSVRRSTSSKTKVWDDEISVGTVTVCIGSMDPVSKRGIMNNISAIRNELTKTVKFSNYKYSEGERSEFITCDEMAQISKSSGIYVPKADSPMIYWADYIVKDILSEAKSLACRTGITSFYFSLPGDANPLSYAGVYTPVTWMKFMHETDTDSGAMIVLRSHIVDILKDKCDYDVQDLASGKFGLYW